MVHEQLFVFVLHPEVEPTNNLSERQLRNSALARKAHRTNKTDTGAIRQTHIVSVLESLRWALDNFTINTFVVWAGAVVARVVQCMHHSLKLFQPTGPPGEAVLSPTG